MKIPFNDLKPALDLQRAEIESAIKSVLDGDTYINGPHVAAFENLIAHTLGMSYGVGCANGTDAITLTLLALSKFADHNEKEVITVANSAPATVAAILRAGMIPVFADILPNGLMDLEKACLLFNNKTLALLPVHLYGQIVDLSSISGMISDANIFVVEDAAQAYGSTGLENTPYCKCISFYPTKNLGALGDGGMVVTNSTLVANQIHRLKNYGLNPEKCITEANGFNSRLDEMQAAILTARWQSFSKMQAMRNTLAYRYWSGLPGKLIHRSFDERENQHLFTIRTKHRKELQRFLLGNEIQTMVHYPVPASEYLPLSPWDGNYGAKVLPETYKFCDEVLSLPLYPGMTIEQVDRVCSLIRDFYSAL